MALVSRNRCSRLAKSKGAGPADAGFGAGAVVGTAAVAGFWAVSLGLGFPALGAGAPGFAETGARVAPEADPPAGPAGDAGAEAGAGAGAAAEPAICGEGCDGGAGEAATGASAGAGADGLNAEQPLTAWTSAQPIAIRLVRRFMGQPLHKLIELVGATRFELATPCTPCKCATRLRHAPTEGANDKRLTAKNLDQFLELEAHLMNELLALVQIDLCVVPGEPIAGTADGEALFVQ